MPMLDKLKPAFWSHRNVETGPYKHLFNYRRIWYLAVLVTSCVVLAPLVFMSVIDYRVGKHDVESHIVLRTSRTVSNAQRTLSFFLEERTAVLKFIVHQNSFQSLNKPERLKSLLENLKIAFGGFSDIGIIDAFGYQSSYEGPYELEGKNYSDQEWYRKVVERGVYISEVFLGYRSVPHLVIAVTRVLPGKGYYVLRATLETEKFDGILSGLKLFGHGEAFLINHKGTIQTPSLSYGKVLEQTALSVPEYAGKTRVIQGNNVNGEPLVIGYRYIENTPFILMVVKLKEQLMKSWDKTRQEIIWFLFFSIVVILAVIVTGGTYLISKTYRADEERVISMHQAEYANNLASVGRLAAGIAHEINNPLAIINEKAGLIKDLLVLREECQPDKKLIALIEVVESSVERCAAITRGLLGFVRHMKDEIEFIDLESLINQVLGFQGKEAEYRSLDIRVNVSAGIPRFRANRGKLQQILLNLINNAFAALSDGGSLEISASQNSEGRITITVSDDGCGISAEAMKRIFEPFVSNKKKKGGTGLGLSITQRLVEEMDGNLDVNSEVGKGTTFTISLPTLAAEEE